MSNDIFYHIGLYQVHLTTDMIQMHQNLVMIGTDYVHKSIIIINGKVN